MATEKRLIDARYLTSQMYLICEAFQTENIFIDAIIDEIDNAPDVDAVEVVRCKNCKEKFEYSPNQFYCFLSGMPIDEDDFCSLGSKMDGEKV